MDSHKYSHILPLKSIFIHDGCIFCSLPQDTVVALQALASYAAFSGANAINLMVSVSSPESSSLFRINATNYRTYQSQEVHPLPGVRWLICTVTEIYLISNFDFVFLRFLLKTICI